jgi:phage I-like protein
VHRYSFSVTLPGGDKTPSEFRIFRAGLNPTEHGGLLFDDKAASLVMAAFDRRGTDMVIDLEHDSVNPLAHANRSDAKDARGYCRLELRDGELWAAGVSWSPDGEARLLDRRQKYISPIVLYDDDRRVVEIFNLALVSDPATNYAAPLMLSAGGIAMDLEMIKKALDAIASGDGDAAAGILRDMIAAAAAGDSGDAGDSAALASDDPDSDTPDEEEDASEPAATDAAMAAALRTELRVDRASDVLAEVRRLRAQVNVLELARAADERNERLALVGDLVTLGAELPCTAWSDPDSRVPSDALATMPLAKLRARVEAFRVARPTAPRIKPPKKAGIEALSAEDRAVAESISDPAQQAAFIGLRLAHGGE